MRRLLHCLLPAMLFTLSGCANYTAPVVPPQGFIFTKVKHPITVDFSETPAGATLHESSDKTHFLMIPLPFILPRQMWPSFGWGDNKIADIARDGNIDEVAYAEADVLSILMVYTQMKVTVYGQ